MRLSAAILFFRSAFCSRRSNHLSTTGTAAVATTRIRVTIVKAKVLKSAIVLESHALLAVVVDDEDGVAMTGGGDAAVTQL